MKNKIEQIILKAIGMDKDTESEFKIGSENSTPRIIRDNGYNQALADLRAKAPEIAQEILDSVVGEIEKVSEFADSGDTLKQRIINHLTK
jgi:hypothetical protein